MLCCIRYPTGLFLQRRSDVTTWATTGILEMSEWRVEEVFVEPEVRERLYLTSHL